MVAAVPKEWFELWNGDLAPEEGAKMNDDESTFENRGAIIEDQNGCDEHRKRKNLKNDPPP